jgi:hypothetical protein
VRVRVRFVQEAAGRGIPIAAVNIGRIRADDLLALKIEDRFDTALSFLLLRQVGPHGIGARLGSSTYTVRNRSGRVGLQLRK